MTSVTYTSTEGLDLQGTEVGAWLADTTAETVVAVELVTNGDFGAALGAEWGAGNGASLAIVAGELRITADGTAYGGANHAITCVVGKRYVISATARRGTCVNDVRIAVNVIPDSVVTTSSASNVTIYTDFVATATAHLLLFDINGATTAGETAYFDNISCIIGDEDLSATDQALRYHGTITKSAVNTGAGLMAYSGFSASNYLSRAYGADLDITDQITLMAWVKPSSFSAEQGVAGNHNISSGDIGGYLIYILTTGAPRFITYENGGSYHICDGAASLTLNAWSFLVATMSTSGAMAIYVNGVLAGTATGGVIDSTTNTFKIGVITVAEVPVSPFSAGGISPVRVINGVQTAAQILTTYNREKWLFKTNAPFRQVGESYSLDLDVSKRDRSEVELSNDSVSLSGRNTETVLKRVETFYDMTITNLELADLPTMYNFLHSIRGNTDFTFDALGTIAAPNDPVTAIAKGSFNEQRVGNSDYFNIPLKLKVLD